MFARVGVIQSQPEEVEAGIHRMNEIVLPTLHGQEGFKNLYVLTDRKTGKGYVIALGESEAALHTFTSSDTQTKLASRMREAGSTPPTWEEYEVSIQA